jgi:glutamate synthase (NADPH/NADH) large chain
LKGSGYRDVRNKPHDEGRLNQAILESVRASLGTGEGADHSFEIHNFDRSVGAALAGEIARLFGRDGLPGKPLNLRFGGSAGQSFGVWNNTGMNLRLWGDANDYVGKGMSGGVISIAPHPDSTIVAKRSVIAGNTCLYGATGGEMYLSGQAGERFAVRNSGARVVVEGVGHHGCEYMTGGTVLVLGRTGSNFSAGMTGGRAFVLDIDELFARRCNTESVVVDTIDTGKQSADTELIRSMLRRHVEFTNSPWGRKLLEEFDYFAHYFRAVTPIRDENRNKAAIPMKVVR